jgi:hypothetical protein
VVVSVVVAELQEQLLTWERQLDSREGTIAAWVDGLAPSEYAIGRVCMEHDVESIQAKAAQQDYLAKTCAFSFVYKYSINLSQMLEER